MATRKRGNWSTHELERLRVLYPHSPDEQVARSLRRSVESIRRKARELFQRPAKRGAWTLADDATLRASWGVHDASVIALILSRPEREVRARANQLRAARRRGPWTADEEQVLKRAYGSRSDADLEVCLSRSRQQIQRAAARLCLSKDKRSASRGVGDAGSVRMPRWSDADVHLLEDLYADHDNLEVARRLARSVASVANKASQLGLRKNASMLAEMGRRNVAARRPSD